MSWAALSFLKSCIKPLIGVARKARVSFLRRFHPPDCTCEDLIDYIGEDYFSDCPQFDSLQIAAEAVIEFQRLDEFFSQKLFEGGITAWGKEARNGVISLRETLIPRSYWEFNKIVFREQEIDVYSEEEVVYTDIRFNRKEAIKQLEQFFSMVSKQSSE